MILLVMCAFVVALFMSRYGSPAATTLCLLAGTLMLMISEMALRDAAAGHPWARQDVIDPATVWWMGVWFLAGSLLGLAIKIRRMFFRR